MRPVLCVLLIVGACLTSRPALAQDRNPGNQGFSLNRYEPTAAGEFSFWVDHPWYSATRYFAAGLTFNYAHDPLVFGVSNQIGPVSSTTLIIAHQLYAHVDLAGSFLDRVLITASLPVDLFEQGNAIAGVSPISAPAVSDPRIGAKVRLYGQHYASPFAISISTDVWIPINTFSNPPPFPAQVGESGVRVLPKVILGGLVRSIMWSFVAGFYYRPNASVGGLAPGFDNTAGSELQFGAAIAYADIERRFAVGLESMFHTVVLGNQAFLQQTTGLEVLLGAHYNVARLFQIGVAGGIGALRDPGTPDARVLLRLAYAPMRKGWPKLSDGDGDGVPDRDDLCPEEPQGSLPDPDRLGCPLPDRDGDGVTDAQDLCPDEPQGANPDPKRLGCPIHDRDGDGVVDAEDLCPDEPQGPNPDPNRRGCPDKDSDGDGVLDSKDQCKDVPAGPNPDPDRPGCPDKDSDGDGVFDSKDQCKDVPAGSNPDPDRPGCPLSDRDHDLVPDKVDACPDQPGAPSPDPKRNGCPGLVEVKNGMIVILQQVFFATGKDIILPKSFKVLDAVADVLKQVQTIKRVAIEGHTDDKGKADYNRDLSDRRAKSVMAYVISHGIDASRLEAHGYGPDRPVVPNSDEKNRALNRRVDFRIVDPAPGELDAPNAAQHVIETPTVLPDAEPEKKTPSKPVKKPAKPKKGGKVNKPAPTAGALAPPK
jgi:outer membrane protein OmpA-like peptidoglycan-associated protein